MAIERAKMKKMDLYQRKVGYLLYDVLVPGCAYGMAGEDAEYIESKVFGSAKSIENARDLARSICREMIQEKIKKIEEINQNKIREIVSKKSWSAQEVEKATKETENECELVEFREFATKVFQAFERASYTYKELQGKDVIFDDYDWCILGDDYSAYDIARDEAENAVECLFETECDNGFVVIADLGLWNGRQGAYKTTKEDLWKTICSCCEDYNCLFVKNRRLFLDACHHDGTNHFEIRRLTDKGRELVESAECAGVLADVELLAKSPYSKSINIKKG